MPYFGNWETMPENTDELAERIMKGYLDGVKDGRQQGAEDLADQVDDWVKRRYFSVNVRRGSEQGEALLEIARTLVHDLRYGDLGKVPEYRERKKPQRPKSWGQ